MALHGEELQAVSSATSASESQRWTVHRLSHLLLFPISLTLDLDGVREPYPTWSRERGRRGRA